MIIISRDAVERKIAVRRKLFIKIRNGRNKIRQDVSEETRLPAAARLPASKFFARGETFFGRELPSHVFATGCSLVGFLFLGVTHLATRFWSILLGAFFRESSLIERDSSHGLANDREN